MLHNLRVFCSRVGFLSSLGFSLAVQAALPPPGEPVMVQPLPPPTAAPTAAPTATPTATPTAISPIAPVDSLPPGAAATLPAGPSLLRGSSVGIGPSGQATPAPLWRLTLSNLLVLRLNPVGLEDQVRFGFQRRLPALEGQTGRLFADRFVFFGIAPRLNPAFVKIGPSIEIQPLSILNLRVAAEYVGFFSTFGFLQSYPSAQDEYSDQRIANCASADATVRQSCGYRDGAGVEQLGSSERRNYQANGFHLMIEPLVQLKLGQFALRNKLALEYWYMNVRDGDRVFFDVTLDTLVPTRGWVLANDLDLLWVSKFGLIAGVRYTAVMPFYGGKEVRPGESAANIANGLQRLGPMLSYTFFDRGFTRFNKPTLMLVTGFYLSHRYRAGQEPAAILPGVYVHNRAMPYIVVGFSFQSDLLKSARR